ncbi:unnamed protein product, partial [Polarella glacialis]
MCFLLRDRPFTKRSGCPAPAAGPLRGGLEAGCQAAAVPVTGVLEAVYLCADQWFERAIRINGFQQAGQAKAELDTQSRPASGFISALASRADPAPNPAARRGCVDHWSGHPTSVALPTPE